jgi:hypothetical protein
MTAVAIKIYETDGSAAHGDRQLIRTIHHDTGSHKQLTGVRAKHILKQVCPEVGESPTMTKTDDGWLHSRSSKASPGSSYQFVWHQYLVCAD